MSFIDNIIWFIQTIFTIYLVMLWLRILLPSTHTDMSNPVSQLVMRFTNIVVNPVQRFLPRVKFDYVTLIILFIIQIIELYVVGFLETNALLNFFAICLWALAQTINLLLAIFVWSIIIEVVFSWLSILRRKYYATQDVLLHLTGPILKPIRRVIPPLGQLDFSPVIALILLFVIEQFMVSPLVRYAILWAFNSSVDVV